MNTSIGKRSIIASALCALLLAAGCGNSGDDAAPPTTAGARADSGATQPAPEVHSTPVPEVTPVNPATVDRQSPETVAIAALETIYTVEPAVDDSAVAAYERAAPLLSPRMLGAIRAIETPSGSDPNWGTWKRRNAVVTAEATILRQDNPVDTDRAHRFVKLVQTVHTTSGTRSQEPVYLFVGLVHEPDGWVLDSMKPV